MVRLLRWEVLRDGIDGERGRAGVSEDIDGRGHNRRTSGGHRQVQDCVPVGLVLVLLAQRSEWRLQHMGAGARALVWGVRPGLPQRRGRGLRGGVPEPALPRVLFAWPRVPRRAEIQISQRRRRVGRKMILCTGQVPRHPVALRPHRVGAAYVRARRGN